MRPQLNGDTLGGPMARDNFSAKTKDVLAKRVGFICSNPHCGKATSGPHDDVTKAVSIGVAAHIRAASPGGPRSAPNIPADERTVITNGIWLCASCSVLVDRDVITYSTERLQEWKRVAEQIARTRLEAATQFAKVSSQPSGGDFSVKVGELVFTPNDSGLGTVSAPWGTADLYMRDGVAHIEFRRLNGESGHFTLTRDGRIDIPRLPRPLQDYALDFHEPDVVSRQATPVEGGTLVHVELRVGHFRYMLDHEGRVQAIDASAKLSLPSGLAVMRIAARESSSAD